MLRICESLHDRLEAAAHANQRSLNAEIVARLEASFGDGALLARMHRLEELTRHRRPWPTPEALAESMDMQCIPSTLPHVMTPSDTIGSDGGILSAG
jgi:hypothetical protein